MSKLFTGSVCLTDLIEQAKKKHSAFTKSQVNGKIYANLLLWDNEEKDKYDNTHSMQLNSTKEMKDAEGKIYVGNFKPVERKEPIPVSDNDTKDLADDLPF
jgi:hypothetical protein